MASNLKIVVLILPALSAMAVTPARAGPTLRIWGTSCRAPAVIDGATLRCSGQRVRLIGVDAPAPRHGMRPAEPHGREAKRQLKRLTRGEVHCSARGYQNRDEWVGKCHTNETPDLGAAMIRSGLVAYDGDSYGDYTTVEQEARAARRGRWSATPAVSP